MIFCDLYSESEQRQTMAQNVALLLEAIYVILRLSVYENMQRGAPKFLETQEAEKFQTFYVIEEFIDVIYNETGRAVGETWKKYCKQKQKHSASNQLACEQALY